MSDQQDPLAGIKDLEAKVLESMVGNPAVPQLLVGFFALAPILAGIMFNAYLKSSYPSFEPTLLTWTVILTLYLLEIGYSVKKWLHAHSHPWLSMRYWADNFYWDNEFLMLKPVVLGTVNPTTGMAATKYGLVKKPDHPRAGPVISELRFANKHFPKMLLSSPEKVEVMVDFEGNSGLVIDGGLLFEVHNIGAVSYVRCDFIMDDDNPFIPIGVFSDCSKIASDIQKGVAPYIPTKEDIKGAIEAHDAAYRSFYYRKWRDTEAILKHTEGQQEDIDEKIDQRIGAISEARRRARDFGSPGVRLPRPTRRGWLVIGTVIFLLALTIWTLAG